MKRHVLSFTLLVVAAGSAQAAVPMNGQYCLIGNGKDYSMLLVGRGMGPELSFAYTVWSGGHNFSVAGTASGGAGEWVQQSSPAQRCSVRITLGQDGTYRVATAQGAQCEASGGARAVPREPEAFPASSRVANAPPNIGVEALNKIGCDSPAGARTRRASPGGLAFLAQAQTAGGDRSVQVLFECSGKVAALAMEIPDPKGLKPAFDLDQFEGPYAPALAKRLTKLSATGPRATEEGSLSAEGFYGSDRSFTLTPYLDVKEMQKIRGVLRVLTEGPARFTWEQGNLSPRAAPMSIGLDVTAAESQQLAAALAPCLGAAPRR